MGIKQLSLGRTDITYLDPRILKADPGFNEREEETEAFKTALAALELSIDAQGVLVPIVLKRNKGGEDGYTYTDGHRRMICIMNLIAKGGISARFRRGSSLMAPMTWTGFSP